MKHYSKYFSCTSEHICFTIKLSPSKKAETCQTQFGTYFGKCKSQYKETYNLVVSFFQTELITASLLFLLLVLTSKAEDPNKKSQ